jgi:predicted secreted protein
MPYIGNQPAPTNVTSTGITDGTILNADINASAAIAISKLDGVTSTNTELNLLDGVTATTAELNYVDGVTSNVQTQLNAKQPYATIAVTVVDSGGNKYALDGTVQQLGLLTPSVTYRFDQSDSSNSGHPLLLSTTSNGTHGGGSAFTTGVTAVGTPGNAGAYTQVKLEQDAPDTLYYYCSSHSGMGGEVDVRATVSSLSDLGVTSTAAELNILDGVTSTAAELNILDGVTATATELNLLDGVTATTAELNYLDIATLGLTAASKAVTADANGVVSFDNGTTEESTVVTSSSNAATINLRDGNVFTHTLSENVTYTFSNPAASGRASAFILKVVQDSSARTITWPGTVDWAAATAPTITATNAGIDVFAFITVDGGSNYYGFTLGQAMG